MHLPGCDILAARRSKTNDTDEELDRLRSAYKSAVDIWVAAIRGEEQLAPVKHTLAQIDSWENAHFVAEDARRDAEAAKAVYEAALRSRFFDID